MSDEIHEPTRMVMAEIADLKEQIAALLEGLQQLDARVNELSLRMRQFERPKMTNDEALRTFNALKTLDASLSLSDFAHQYGFSYDALRQARARRQKKKTP